MINNSEYIKMILALPDEFFEGWEWNYGDTFILKVASDKWIVHHIGDFELINNDIGTWTPIGGCESTFEKVEEARRPIPSQEQLQDIMKKHWFKLDSTVQSYGVMKYFCNWFQAHWIRYPDYKEVENDSITSIWLRYVMDFIYYKTWDGERWT